MRKIGIVGGVGWRSTMDYYSELCRRSEEWCLARDSRTAPEIPEISIESLDHTKAVAYLGCDDDDESWRQFDQYHRAALKRLEASGAEFALIASNTPHHRFAEIVCEIRIPVLNIFDEVARTSARIGAKQVLILGTAQTMESPVFRRAFAKHGVDAAGPNHAAARAMVVELVAELQLGKLDSSAERLGRIVAIEFEAKALAQPVVSLACTELTLPFQLQKSLATFEHDGVFYINNTAVHIDAAFDFAVAAS